MIIEFSQLEYVQKALMNDLKLVIGKLTLLWVKKGQKAQGSHHLLTMVDRKSRFVYIKKVHSRSGWEMLKMLEGLIKTKQIKSISLTTDNGWEFSKLGILAKKLNIKVYLCEPYCSFQKGTNENLNGLVHRTWPKKTRFNNNLWRRNPKSCRSYQFNARKNVWL